jgi:hypothetical protein
MTNDQRQRALSGLANRRTIFDFIIIDAYVHPVQRTLGAAGNMALRSRIFQRRISSTEQESTWVAVVFCLRYPCPTHLQGSWRPVLSFPNSFRDYCYLVISRFRKQIPRFGGNACRLLAADERDRFLCQ